MTGHDPAGLSERHLREVLDYSRNLIYRLRLSNLSFEYIGAASTELIGFTPEEIKRLGFQAVFSGIHPDDQAQIPTLRGDQRNPGSLGAAVMPLEFRFLHRDGAYRWFSGHRVLLFDKGGQPVAAVGSFQDVTEFKRAEDELRRYREHLEELVEQRTRELAALNEHLRMIMDQAPAVLWTTDRDLRFTSSRGARLAELQLRPGQVVGLSLREFFQTDDPAFLGLAMHRRALAGESATYELEWGGRTHQSHVEPLRDALGTVVGCIGVALDVTELKRAERAAHQSEVMYRALVEQIPAITYTAALDEASTTTYVSPQVEQLLGYTPADYAAAPDVRRQRLHAEDRARVLAELARSKANNAPFVSEYRMLARDGRVVWLRDQARVVHDEAGRPLVLQGVMFDITERRQTEELLRLERDLGLALSAKSDLSEALNTLLDAACRVEGIDCGMVYLRALVTGALDAVCHRGLTPEFVAACAHFSADTPQARVLCASQPIYQHARDTSPIEPARQREGLRARAIIPVLHEGQVVASLNLASHSEDEVPLNARQVLEAIATRLGGVIVRIRAEARLRSSEERFRALCTTAPVGIFLADDQARCVYTNPRLQAICGLSEPECLGYGWNASIDPEDRAAVLTEIARQQQTGGGFAHEFRLRRPDGSQRWVRAHTADVQSGGPELRLRIGIVEDITERRRAAEALRESEAKFRALAETVAAAIVIARDRQVLYANSATEVLTGYTRAEYGQMDFWGVVHPEHRELVRQRGLARLKGEAVAARYEVKLLTKTGAERWVDLSASVVEYDGQPALLATAFDITDRRRAEEQARQHQEQLAHVARVSTMGEMASGLAHELAQPLSAMLYYAKGCVTHLRTGTWGTAEAAGAMEKVAAQAERAGEFIRRLKEFVRRAQPARAPADLNAIVRETLGLADYEAQAKRVAVRFEAADDLPKVVVDTIQIEQVILNLVRNGMDAMEQTPAGERELVIRTWTGPGDTVHVSVRDAGRGLSADAAAHLFDPFFTTKPGGTGLGLPISRSIIEAHEGQLWAQGDLPRGTLFGFTLPAAQETKRAAD